MAGPDPAATCRRNTPASPWAIRARLGCGPRSQGTPSQDAVGATRLGRGNSTRGQCDAGDAGTVATEVVAAEVVAAGVVARDGALHRPPAHERPRLAHALPRDPGGRRCRLRCGS